MRELSFTGAPLPGDPQFLEWVRASLFEIMNASRDGENDDPTAYAPLDDPDLTGTPTAPTAAPGTSTTQIATTAFVVGEVGAEATARSSEIASEITSAITAEEAARNAAIAAALQIADDRILANISGAPAGASATELTALLDAIIGTARGNLLVRGETAWAALAPGTAGRFLQSQGASADLTWGEVAPPLWTTVFKAEDQSRTSSTAWADVTDMSFEVVSGEIYNFEFRLPYVAGAAELHLALNGPAFTLLHNAINVTAYDSTIMNLGASRAAGYATFPGLIKPSANGTLSLRMRQGSSSADAVTIRAGAMLQWAKAP